MYCNLKYQRSRKRDIVNRSNDRDKRSKRCNPVPWNPGSRDLVRDRDQVTINPHNNNNNIRLDMQDIRDEIRKLKKRIIDRPEIPVPAVPYNTMPCNTMPCNAMPCHVLVSDKISLKSEKLSLNGSFFMEKNEKNIKIYGNYCSPGLKILDLAGTIVIDGIRVQDFSDAWGSLSVVNFETGTIFDGLVYFADHTIKYILSNRPLVQIKLPFNGMISILVIVTT
jgi:hypothetical protein